MRGDNDSAWSALRRSAEPLIAGFDKNLECSFKRKFTSLSANNRIHVNVMSAREASDTYDPNRNPIYDRTLGGRVEPLQLYLKQHIFCFNLRILRTSIGAITVFMENRCYKPNAERTITERVSYHKKYVLLYKDLLVFLLHFFIVYCYNNHKNTFSIIFN